MKIDDLIREHAARLRSAHSHRVPPGLNRRAPRRGWVTALATAVGVVLLIAPVALLLRPGSGSGPVPPMAGAPTSTATTSPTTNGEPAADLAARCPAGGRVVPGDATIGYSSIDAAIGAAAGANGLADLEFSRESTSDTWVAGSSDDPRAIIALSSPDGGTEWFVAAVTICSPNASGDRIGPGESEEFTALPYRLLVEGAAVGDVYVTAVAASAAEFDALWSGLGLVGRPPEVDFESSVVFYFGAVESGSCPLGPIEGLRYNAGEQKIYPEIPVIVPSGTNGCTDDANRHAVLVAVDRVDLPPDGFSLWISADDPPDCCGDGVTFVAAGELTAPPDAAYPPLGADGRLAVGESRLAYRVGTHCGVEWLPVSVNGQNWRATDLDRADAAGIDRVPSAWGRAGDSLDLVLTLLDESTLEVTVVGTGVSVTYAPGSDAPGCA